jgi:hypothetical protein
MHVQRCEAGNRLQLLLPLFVLAYNAVNNVLHHLFEKLHGNVPWVDVL